MAVPKRKMSRSRTRSRRAQWTAQIPELVPVTTPDGRQVRVPARLVPAVRRGLVVPD
ncbi:50S ribosomal protein L32 [Promicromonospora sp. MS192]|uniref:50S ribosomal protein L32 n=1 Tax=Promicromonospora sp. MS192 TaxID=3412684 RepID=UPI003C2F19C6